LQAADLRYTMEAPKLALLLPADVAIAADSICFLLLLLLWLSIVGC
jgi:hypothetical protein